jgi:hypothetical protein
VDHLLFSCPVAKVIWGILAICFQQKDRPTAVENFDPWIRRALPQGE